MNVGRRLIIYKQTRKVIFDFGEMSGDLPEKPRPNIEDLVFMDLEYGQHKDEFSRLKDGLNSVTVIDFENKVLQFDLNPPSITPEQQIAELQQKLLQSQGVI